MKKVHSKSTITKKNNTVGALPESKKNSRVHKANSYAKISQQSSEQISSNLIIQPNLSKSNIHNFSQKVTIPVTQTNYPQIQNKSIHLIDRPQSQRKSHNNHNAKSSIQTVPISLKENREEILQLKQNNQQLTKQNHDLKKKCTDLQQMSLRDRQKIKNLIIRINQVKNQRQMTTQAKTLQPSNSKLGNRALNGTESFSLLPQKQKMQTPYKRIQTGPCDRADCLERMKYLQNELYHQRLQRDKLELQRREWQRNRQNLKQQYNQLLDQIRMMKQSQF